MKIFIIDDEQVSLFITQQLLISNGIRGDVHTFLSAEEALNSINGIDEIPDFIFLDLNMPVMNGWQFLDALAQRWASLVNKCRIYFLTSSLDYVDGEKAKKHPMIAGLMYKPVSCENIRLIFPQRECM